MAFQFPANPTVGQQYAPATGTTYEWNGTGWIFLGMNTASLYPAGIILPFAGATVSFQGWLLCNGASYTTAAQPVLFAVIGYAYGGGGANFSVPDLRGRVIAGVDGGAGRLTSATLAAGLGAERVVLTAGELAAHAHGITDVAHAHGVSDPTHAHSVYDPSHAHAHALYDPWHSHGVTDQGHTHSTEQGVGYSFTPGSGPYFPGPGDRALQTAGGNTTHVSSNTSVAAGPTGITLGISAAGTGIGVYGAGTGIGIAASGTGLATTNNTGSNGGHINVQPTLCLNYIIKA